MSPRATGRVLLAVIVAAATAAHAGPAGLAVTATVVPAVAAAALAPAAPAAAALAPPAPAAAALAPPARAAERVRPQRPADTVKSATDLPRLADVARRSGETLAAVNDTFLVLSHAFDVLAGGCSPRGWTAEERANQVYAHVSDRFKVNLDVFTWRDASGPPAYPAPISGTPIRRFQSIAVNDSGMVLCAEGISDGGRIVAIYPDQNLMRTYAMLPTDYGDVNRPHTIAFDKATGGLIVGSTYIAGNGGGMLWRIPAGGGTATLIAGRGYTRLDAPAGDAVLELPEEIVTDAAGNIYFCEGGNPFTGEWPRVRMLRRSDNQIVTLAGRLFWVGNDGDGGPAVDATLDVPSGLALNAAEDTLYVLDTDWYRVRAISLTTGIIDALPGAQGYDFINSNWFLIPKTLAFAGGRLYVGCQGQMVAWSGGSLSMVAGEGNALREPEDAALGNAHQFDTVQRAHADAAGGVVFIEDRRALVYRLDSANRISVVAGVAEPMSMGERALWFGADMTSAAGEVANWVEPSGYGLGWSQRLTSPPFSFADHPGAVLSFDVRVELEGDGGWDMHEQPNSSAFSVRGLKADGTWQLLSQSFVTLTRSLDNPSAGGRLTGRDVGRCRVDLTGQPLANVTRLQIVVQTHRFGASEDGLSFTSQAAGVQIDNLRLVDGTDVLPPLDFENGTTGAWTLSAVNAPYGDVGDGLFYRDIAPPATDVTLRSGFDFSDPTCVWTFTAADTVPDGVYSRITSPWIGLADPRGLTHIAFSGKLATDNQKRFLRAFVRTKRVGETRPRDLWFSNFILSSGTSGSDVAAPFLNQNVLRFPWDFDNASKGGGFDGDSIQIVFQIEDRLEEESASFPAPRVRSRLPYLDAIRVYQRSGDRDFDGVADALDACPDASSAGQDLDGDGCPEPTATLRHVETWTENRRPIRVRLSQEGDPRVADGSDLQAVRDAMAAWVATPNASVPLVEDPATAQTDADALDGVNVVTWSDDLQFSPDVLAVTPTTSFTGRGAHDDQIVLPGVIVDSDLIFNSAARFRTAATGPIPNSVDLRSVATHEIGHLLGLSHSGVEQATMFPVLQAGEDAATLEEDDRAAIGAAYPAASYEAVLGAITGDLRRGRDGTPIPGALVTAWSLDLGDAPIRAVASDYTNESGSFALWGLAAGRYGVRVAPLDGSVPALIPAAINARVLEIAQTNFIAEWWSQSDDGLDDVALITPIVVAPGLSSQGHRIVTTIDATPPEIVSILPADAATGVGISGRILVNLSEPCDGASMVQAFFLRRAGDTGRLGGQAQLLNNNRTFIFAPDDPLAFGTEYEVEIQTDLTDREGVPLATTYLSRFTTLPVPDVAIFDIQPRQAPPGAMITIRGAGLSGVVQFEWRDAGGPVITSGGGVATGDAYITRIDPSIVSGPIRMIADGDTSNAFNFTVLTPSAGVPAPLGAPVPLPFSPSDVAVSTEGLGVFAVGEPGIASINLSPTRARYREADFRALPGARRIAMARDGRHAYVTRPDSSDLIEVDTDTTSAGFGQAFVRIPLPGPPGGVLPAPDGARAFVTEDHGERVWIVDVDPTSATYRGVLVEHVLAGVTLTGGIGVTTATETAMPTGIAGRGRDPRTAAASTYSELLLTTSSHGQIVASADLGTFDVANPRPCTDNLEMTPDAVTAIAIGAGAAEGSLTRSCPLGACTLADPLATVGGRPRDLLVNPRTGALFVVNAVAGQLQVLRPQGNGYVVGGVVGTGRSPVAIATDASGEVTAVANAGDRTIGVYSVVGGPELAEVLPSAAFPGDQATVLLSDGMASGFSVDLGAAAIAPTFTRQSGLSFTVPDRSPRRVSVTLDAPGARTRSLPLDIVAPIESPAPGPTGRFMLGPRLDCAPEAVGVVRQLLAARDGRTLVALAETPTCGTLLHVYELRDDADEPLFSRSPIAVAAESSLPPRAAALTLDRRRMWVVLGTGGLFDVDVDRASPLFGSSHAIGFLPDEAFAVAADPLFIQMFVAKKLPGSPFHAVDVYDTFHDLLGTIDFGITDTLSSLAVSPDGRVLCMGGLGRAFFVDITSRALLGTSTQHAAAGAVTSLAVTSDGRRAVGILRDGSYAVWSLEPGDEGDELHFGNIAAGVTLGAAIAGVDPHSVLVGGSDGSLHRIDVGAAVPAVTSTPLAVPAPVLARTPDGRLLFTAGHPQGAPEDTVRVLAVSDARTMSVVAGDDQEALAGTQLPLPVEVRITDAHGRPQSGVLVEFALADASQGSLTDAAALTSVRYTDIAGNAAVRWTLPSVPGPVSLAVRTLGLSVPPLAVSALAVEDAATAVPRVAAFGPVDGSTGMAAGTEVFVRFTQAMDSAATVAYVGLTTGPDPIPGGYRFDETGRTLFFKPLEPLPHLARCVLRVDAGALDRDGQALEVADSAAFTVQAEPVLGIAVVSPPAGASGTAVTLNGQGFSPVPGLNVVRFNGVSAAVLSATTRTLVARVPATATTGTIDVQVASVTSNGVPFVVLPEDATPGTVVDTLPAPRQPLRLVLTPDGRRAYVVSPPTNAIGVLDIFTAAEIALIPVGANPRAIAMLPDGSRAYVANTDGGSVSVIDTQPSSATYNRVVGSIVVGSRPIAIAAIHAGPQVVVVCEGDATARVIDAQAGNATFDQVVRNVPLPSGGTSVTVSPDGTRVFIGTLEGVSILDLQSFVVKNVPLPSGGTSVTVSPDGGLLFVITEDRHLVVIDVAPTSDTPNRVVKSVPLPSGGTSVTVSPDGALLYVVVVEDGRVLVYEIGPGTANGDGASSGSPTAGVSLTPIAAHATGVAPAGMAVDPFGDFLLVANQGSDDLTLLLANDAPPHVRVTHPNGGETLIPGAPATLRWDTDRFPVGQRVDLYLSRDLGAHWEAIALDLANTGSFEWLVTGPNTGSGSDPEDLALFEVRARGPFGGTDADRSDAPFAIFDATTPTLLVEFAAEPRADGMEIRWRFAPGSDAREVVVERAAAVQGPWEAVVQEARAEGGALVVLDRAASQGRSYWYRLAARMAGGVTRFGPIAAAMPRREFALDPITPNPASGAVTIGFALEWAAPVQVGVVDVSGRRVASLVDGTLPAGTHRVVWNGVSGGAPAAAGVYFVRYAAAGRTITRRFALLP